MSLCSCGGEYVLYACLPVSLARLRPSWSRLKFRSAPNLLRYDDKMCAADSLYACSKTCIGYNHGWIPAVGSELYSGLDEKSVYLSISYYVGNSEYMMFGAITQPGTGGT